MATPEFRPVTPIEPVDEQAAHEVSAHSDDLSVQDLQLIMGALSELGNSEQTELVVTERELRVVPDVESLADSVDPEAILLRYLSPETAAQLLRFTYRRGISAETKEHMALGMGFKDMLDQARANDSDPVIVSLEARARQGSAEIDLSSAG